MTVFSGRRTRSRKMCPSGFTNACTVASLGMSCAEAGAAQSISAARSNTSRRRTNIMDMAKCRDLFGPRPSRQRTLVHRGHGGHSFGEESLEPFSLVGLGCVDVSLRVGRDGVHAVELSGLTAAVAEGCQLLQRLAIDNLHLFVHAIGHVDVALLRVFRESDVPHRAGILGVRLVERFLDELAFGCEYLEPVASAVADIDQ